MALSHPLAPPAETAAPRFAPGLRAHVNGLALWAALATLICATPALTVLTFALSPSRDHFEFGGALMRDGALGTAGLVLVGGAGATLFGAAAALLVTLCRFPGRKIFECLLVAPLAAPAYVLAYAYSSLTWAGGPIAFPVTGFWGAALIYALGLYPYVYLSARAGLTTQSASALEAARVLGTPPGALLWRVAAPLARPSLAAGAALACMEIAADYGAAQHFGVTTLSTAIFRAWYAHGSPHGALRIAAVLLVTALVFLSLERSGRGRAAYSTARWSPLPRFALPQMASLGATAFCTALVVLGAGLPLAWLMRLAWLHGDLQDLTRPLLNTIALAGVGALVTLALASIIAAAARTQFGVRRYATYAASLGYAAPGAVIALGALALVGAARQAGLVAGFGTGLALVALIWTYAARFAAAGAQPIEAGLARAPKNLAAAAASLGASPWRRLWRVELPIAAPSLAAGGLILFVEIVKELPATLILRPFDFDTLAVKAYAYASDERLLQAAAPSLLVFAAGIAPVIMLSRRIGKRTPA